jgi:hypothetical protein
MERTAVMMKTIQVVIKFQMNQPIRSGEYSMLSGMEFLLNSIYNTIK